MAALLPNGRQQFIDDVGRPLVGGQVFFYEVGTEVAKDTYQDDAATILNTNPVILDDRGEATIFGVGKYRQVLKDSLGNLIWDKTTDDVQTTLQTEVDKVAFDLSQFEKDLAGVDGAGMVGLAQGGTVQNAISYVTPEMFGAEGDGEIDDSNALQAALDYLKDNTCKYLLLGTGAKYRVTVPLTAYAGSKIIGDRHGIQNQGEGSNSDSSTPADRAANPLDSAILWYGDTGETWITCERNVTISGVVFGAPDQNWEAASYDDVKDYGTAIVGVRGLNVLSCVYYGMTNFVSATSECVEIRWNTGFCNQVDFSVSDSSDIIRINDNHGNPNCIRPPSSYSTAIANSGRVFISLKNHDGAFLSGNFAYQVNTFIKNYAASGRLGSLNVVNSFSDRTATFLDNDTYTGAPINISNSYTVSDSAQDDSGTFILRKTNGEGFSTPIFISNFAVVKASTPITQVAQYTFYMDASAGYKIRTSSLYSDLDNWDSGYSSNIYIGDNFRGTTYYENHNKYVNYVPNPGMSRRNLSGGIPSGWVLDNCAISYMGKKLTASSSSGGSAACTFRAPMPANGHTYIVKATTVGSSEGIGVTEVSSDGTSTTNYVAWSRLGGAYYAVYVSTLSGIVSHTIKVNVQTDSVNFDYAALISASGVIQYNLDYYESGQPISEVGGQAYITDLAAGATHTVVADPAATSGVYDLYVASELGMAHYQLIKLSATSTPTVTEVTSAVRDGFSYTVSWPSSSLPTIAVSDASKYRISLIGAAPSL